MVPDPIPESPRWGSSGFQPGRCCPFRAWLLGLAVVLGLASSSMAQSGLLGEYYDTPFLTQLAETRVDLVIDFTGWGSHPTGTSVEPDSSHSERWTGYVFIDQAGTWTFSTRSNDGVRLWLDGALVIMNWTAHSATFDRVTLPLTEGWHPIRLEHWKLQS